MGTNLKGSRKERRLAMNSDLLQPWTWTWERERESVCVMSPGIHAVSLPLHVIIEAKDEGKPIKLSPLVLSRTLWQSEMTGHKRLNRAWWRTHCRNMLRLNEEFNRSGIQFISFFSPLRLVCLPFYFPHYRMHHSEYICIYSTLFAFTDVRHSQVLTMAIIIFAVRLI